MVKKKPGLLPDLVEKDQKFADVVQVLTEDPGSGEGLFGKSDE